MARSFRLAPLLEAMLSFAAFEERPFNGHDAYAMAGALETIRCAMVQPVGATPDAKRRDPRAVTDAEYDRAVATVLCCAMTLWLSGGLAKWTGAGHEA